MLQKQNLILFKELFLFMSITKGVPRVCRFKEARSHGAEVPDSCKQPHVGARNQALVPRKNRKCLLQLSHL